MKEIAPNSLPVGEHVCKSRIFITLQFGWVNCQTTFPRFRPVAFVDFMSSDRIRSQRLNLDFWPSAFTVGFGVATALS